MKKSILLIILAIPLVTLAQLDYALQISTNYPVDFSSGKITRKLGAEAQFSLIKKVNEVYGIESGFLFDSHGRIKSDEVKNSYLTLQFYIPIMGCKSFNDEKILIKTGVLLAARNIFTFKKYDSSDRELGFSDGSNEYYPSFRSLGIDFGIGSEYKINKKLKATLNYHMPFNIKKQEYGVLSCGLKYQIVSH
jgi:hypothetical protein